MAPIKTINFNENLNINNISHVASAYDNNLWLFDENTRELLIYNYKKEKYLPCFQVKQIETVHQHPQLSDATTSFPFLESFSCQQKVLRAMKQMRAYVQAT